MFSSRQNINVKDKYDTLYLLLAIVFCLFYLYSSYLYNLRAQPQIEHHDSVKHLHNAYYVHKDMNEHGAGAFFIKYSYGYPPLVYYVTFLFFRLFGVSISTAIYSQAVFWLILVLSVFGICKKVINAEAGFVGVMIFLAIPGLNDSMAVYILDLPLVAVSALALFCLLKSEEFKNRFWSYAFFVSFALGMLTKRMFPVYLIPPLLIVLFSILRDLKRNDRRLFHNVKSLLIALSAIAMSFWLFNILLEKKLIFAGMPGAWPRVFYYIASLLPMIGGVVIIQRLSGIDPRVERIAVGTVISAILVWHVYGMNFWKLFYYAVYYSMAAIKVEGFKHYVDRFLSTTYGIPVLIYMGVGVVFYIVRTIQKKTGRDQALVFWSLVVAGVVLSLLPENDPRYTLPALVFAVPLSAYWMFSIKKAYLRAPVLIVVLYMSFVGMYGWSMRESPFLVKPLRGAKKQTLFSRPAPRKEGFAIEDVSGILYKLSKGRRAFIVVVTRSLNTTTALSHGVYITLLYKYNDRYHFSQYFGKAHLSRTGKLTSSDWKRDHYVFLSPGRSMTKPQDFDVIVALQADDGKDEVIISEGLRRLCAMNGLSHRPDVYINPGDFPGLKRTQMTARIARIPIKRKYRPPPSEDSPAQR